MYWTFWFHHIYNRSQRIRFFLLKTNNEHETGTYRKLLSAHWIGFYLMIVLNGFFQLDIWRYIEKRHSNRWKKELLLNMVPDEWIDLKNLLDETIQRVRILFEAKSVKHIKRLIVRIGLFLFAFYLICLNVCVCVVLSTKYEFKNHSLYKGQISFNF